MSIHIELASKLKSYYAGQVVEGRVVIHNTKPKKAKEVTILLQGGSRVKWFEHEARTNHPSQQPTPQHIPGKPQPHPFGPGKPPPAPEHEILTVEYSAEEKYTTQTISLFGDGENVTELPVGTTTFPFRFPLPTNLPSSFSNLHGEVLYFLNAEIKRPTLVPNDHSYLPITVNGTLDLNSEPGACFPQTCKKVQGPNCCVCRNGQLSFEISLPKRSGYIPGEFLDLQAKITNGTNKNVNWVKAFLQQEITFHAQGKSKTVTGIVGGVKGPEVEQGEDETWLPENFKISPVPPTRLGGMCRLIDLQYFVLFEVDMAGLSSSVFGRLPIMIGTVPLKCACVNFRPASCNIIRKRSSGNISPCPPPPSHQSLKVATTEPEIKPVKTPSKERGSSRKASKPNLNVFVTRASSAPLQPMYVYDTTPRFQISVKEPYKYKWIWVSIVAPLAIFLFIVMVIVIGHFELIKL